MFTMTKSCRLAATWGISPGQTGRKKFWTVEVYLDVSLAETRPQPKLR
jgi:hypothetical protein